jgi:hypothetical protein
LTDESEIIEYLKDEKENQNSINALKHFLSIKIGDKIAVKASGSPKGNKGFLSIVGICEVIQDDDGKVYNYEPNGLGHTISVKYIKAPIYKEFELGGYGSTVHHLSKEDHIAMIFKSEDPSVTIKDLSNIPKEVKVIYAYLKKSLSHRKIQSEVLGEDAPARGGGFLAMEILHGYEIQGDKKGILNNTLFSVEYNNADGKYLEALELLKEYYPEFADVTNKIIEMKFPLNTILYGPPGTGKTYNTILRAAEIVENRKISTYSEALKIFKDNLHNKIEFITFHQNYSYEDFIQGLRPETDNKSSLTFEKKDGVFKKIADKALENIKLSEKAPEELSNEALFDSALEKFKELVEEKEDNYQINETAYIMEVEVDAFRYTGEKWTNHANGLRMKFSDLKEFYKNEVKSRKDVKHLNNISGLAGQHATYYFLVYEKIIKLLPKRIDTPLKVQKKNYVIVIDEINRANISRVFGELITLIEPDKRSHGEIPLESKLPSGDYFVVPSNLYIIGTMNTADKSIALLDIALRRRFEFESMYPLYDIEGSEIYDKDILLKINEQIIKSKGHDFQIGHAYFMGENKDLIQRMNKKVIPLLLEYFMNDEKEVKGILYNAGLQVEDNSWPIKITGKRA